MTSQDLAAGTVQLVGGVAAAPLLVGLTQQVKARLQGRRGPGPLQPYRELRRLWGKSAIDVEGTTSPTPYAPSVAAAAIATAVLLVPVALGRSALGCRTRCPRPGRPPRPGQLRRRRGRLGHGNGFALQGVSRDLTLSVAVDAVLVLALAVAALEAGPPTSPP